MFMTHDTVVVLTSKSLKTMVREGGSGNWKANPVRIRRKKFIVAVRNRHSDWTEGTEDHGTAFLIGKVSGTKESPREGRLVITFHEYAEIVVPNQWPGGQRNPVAYKNVRELGIDPDSLEWKRFPGLDSVGESQAVGEKVSPRLVLESAKASISQSLS